MLTHSRLGAVLVAAALLQSALPARGQGQATIDLNHTAAHFAAKHLVISTVQGSIPVKDVKLGLGAGFVPTSLEATLDLTKVDTHNERRDNDLRSDRFFDASKYPEMTFKSTKIVPGKGGAFTMDGILTMHGVSKPLTVNADVEGSIKDNQGRTHVGYSAAASVDRLEWGVGSGIPTTVVGQSIVVTIEAEVIVT